MSKISRKSFLKIAAAAAMGGVTAGALSACNGADSAAASSAASGGAIYTPGTYTGIAQGIGMALFEDVTYNEKGRLLENSFLQYKIPTRLDMGHLKVEFAPSYEPSGPFGAKSIGEIVINTPAPALTHAIYRATGVWHRELPITPEKVLRGIQKGQE